MPTTTLINKLVKGGQDGKTINWANSWLENYIRPEFFLSLEGQTGSSTTDSMLFKIFICDGEKGMLSKSALLDEIISFHGKKRESLTISVVRESGWKEITMCFRENTFKESLLRKTTNWLEVI